MRTIINYIRSCFCKHEWELIYDRDVKETSNYSCCTSTYSVKTYRCVKCGYAKRYKSS